MWTLTQTATEWDAGVWEFPSDWMSDERSELIRRGLGSPFGHLLEEPHKDALAIPKASETNRG